MNYPFVWSILNDFGALKIRDFTKHIFDFNMEMVSNHKKKDIDH